MSDDVIGVIFQDVSNALNDVYNWFASVTGNAFDDTLGTLGSWINSALYTLGNWLYSAFQYISDAMSNFMTYLSDKIHDAWTSASQFLQNGLQWIGSGLSYIAQHLYSFGQWLWNGILWVANSIVNIVENIANWLWGELINIWNTIVDYGNSFIEGINSYLNSWIESIRDKLINMIVVNLSLDGMFRGLDEITKGNIKGGFAGLLVSPLASTIVASMMDSLIPKPSTTYIKFFPELSVPRISPSVVNIPKPPTPSTPPAVNIPTIPIQPSGGIYKPSVNMYGGIGSGYIINMGLIKHVSEGNAIDSSYLYKILKGLTFNVGNAVDCLYNLKSGSIKTEKMSGIVDSSFNYSIYQAPTPPTTVLANMYYGSIDSEFDPKFKVTIAWRSPNTYSDTLQPDNTKYGFMVVYGGKIKYVSIDINGTGTFRTTVTLNDISTNVITIRTVKTDSNNNPIFSKTITLPYIPDSVDITITLDVIKGQYEYQPPAPLYIEYRVILHVTEHWSVGSKYVGTDIPQTETININNSNVICSYPVTSFNDPCYPSIYISIGNVSKLYNFKNTSVIKETIVLKEPVFKVSVSTVRVDGEYNVTRYFEYGVNRVYVDLTVYINDCEVIGVGSMGLVCTCNFDLYLTVKGWVSGAK